MSIWDLLHGLMLPSGIISIILFKGNDSALVLAENLTCMLKE